MAVLSLNRLARLRMGERLRLPSEFDAFVLDYFADSLRLMPDGGDRVAKENVLLQRNGARRILSALDGPSWWIWPGLRLSPLLVGVFILCWQTAGIFNRLFRSAQPSATPVHVPPVSLVASAEMPPPPAEPSGSRKEPDRTAAMHLSNVYSASFNPTISAGMPKAKRPCQASGGQALFPAGLSSDGQLEIRNLPQGHGFQRGSQLLVYRGSRNRAHPLIQVGTAQVVEALGQSLIADGTRLPASYKGEVLCAGILQDNIRVAGEWGRILPTDSEDLARINLGQGDGVKVGDVYEVMGSAISDADISGRSLGRHVTGLLRVIKVSTLFAEVERRQGYFAPFAVVRRVRPGVSAP